MILREKVGNEFSDRIGGVSVHNLRLFRLLQYRRLLDVDCHHGTLLQNCKFYLILNLFYATSDGRN